MTDPWGPGPTETPPGAWDPEIAAGLAAMIADVAANPEDRPPLAVFDWDETCIRGDISETWLTYLDEFVPGMLEDYELGCRVDKRVAYEKLAIDLCKGRTEREIRTDVLAALARAQRDGRIALRQDVRDLFWQLHRRGWEVWIVTASTTPVVQPLAEMYGIHPHRVLGMQCPLGPDGRFLPRLLDPIPYRDGKIAAVRRWIGCDPTLAAGDSDGDLWLLRAARYRILVDRGERGDPALRALAQSEGWWIQRGWS